MEIVFVAAKRTPFGAFGGSFKDVSATDLAVHASKAAVAQAGAKPSDIDHVVFGNVIQTSADAAYLARHVGLKCGLPIETPAVTVNRLCGSGFEAIHNGVRRIQTGEATTVLVGGAENMSQSPFVLRKVRFGNKLGNTELEDSLMTGLYDSFAGIPMAITAENLAEKYELSRDVCDAFALESQRKAAKATSEKRFEKEIEPYTLVERGKEKIVAADEHVRPDASPEGLKKLKPVFKKDGVVTAGNASGMVDGAAALLVTTKENAKKKGWNILGEWVAAEVVGCDPKIMGIGPVPAIQKLFQKTKLSLKDISFVEINEAFAPQTLAVQKALSIPSEMLNVDGGAIAIGHPLGASGARLVAHLLYRLNDGKKGLGLASACIGGGQGMAVLVKV